MNLRVIAQLLVIFLEGQSTLKSLHKMAIVPEWERLAVCKVKHSQNGWIDRWTIKQTDDQMDGWLNRWTMKCMDRQTYEQTDKQTTLIIKLLLWLKKHLKVSHLGAQDTIDYCMIDILVIVQKNFFIYVILAKWIAFTHCRNLPFTQNIQSFSKKNLKWINMIFEYQFQEKYSS